MTPEIILGMVFMAFFSLLGLPFGMTTLELNPIRMRPDRRGRLTPVACDFKCGFDRDDPRWQRLAMPADLFAAWQALALPGGG